MGAGWRKTIGRLIDAAMAVILILQMLYAFLGGVAHEILGILFFVCLIGHIILKKHWFSSLKRWGRQTRVRKLFHLVTILLLLAILLLMVSSIDVSRTLFPGISFLGSAALHRYLAMAVLVISLWHGGLCWYLSTRKKKLVVFLMIGGTALLLAMCLMMIPYLNRHFKTVEIDYQDAVSGETVTWTDNNPLTVYFTREGNTEFKEDVAAVSGASLMLSDGVRMGNTQLLADMVCDSLGCDKAAITLTGDKYPSSYNDTVSVAMKELREQARPEIAPIDLSGYDTIILVYPIWWGTIPMPVATFLEDHDFAGKKVLLIATQGSSGFGQSTRDIRDLIPDAEVIEGVSIYCDDIPKARAQITACLRVFGD